MSFASEIRWEFIKHWGSSYSFTAPAPCVPSAGLFCCTVLLLLNIFRTTITRKFTNKGRIQRAQQALVTIPRTVVIHHHFMHCFHSPSSHAQISFPTTPWTIFVLHRPMHSFKSPPSHAQNALTTIPKTSCRFPPFLRFRQEVTHWCQQTTKLDKKEKYNRITMMDFTLHPQ